MRKRGLLFCIYFIVFLPINAQKLSNLIINTLDSEQGLSEATNAFIYKDHFGFVWISSIEGLNRFDGSRIRVYKSNPDQPNKLYGSNIQSPFFEDKKGDIWFTTELAINCYRRRTDSFDHFFITENGIPLQDILYYAFELDDTNSLWIIANNSYYIFKTYAPYKTTKIMLHDTTNAVRAAIRQSINLPGQIIGCFWENGLGFEALTLNKKQDLVDRTVLMGSSDKIKAQMTTLNTRAESDSLFWIASNLGLVSLNPFDPKKYDMYPNIIKKKGILDFQLYSPDSLITISSSGEVQFFNKKSRTYGHPIQYYFPKNQQTKSLNCRSLWIDNDKKIWTSDYKTGVKYITLIKNGFSQAYNHNDDKTLSITQLIEDSKGNIWCINKIDSSIVLNLSKESHKILLPSYSKIFKNSANENYLFVPNSTYSPNKVSLGLIKDVLSFPAFNATDYIFAPLTDNIELVGAFTGLYFLDIKKKQFSKINNLKNIKRDFFQLCFDSKGHLWIGSSDNVEVLELDNKNYGFNSIKTFLNTGLVNHICNDNYNSNKLWVTTSNGLLEIDINTFDINPITEQSGLPNQYIYAIVQDKKGYLWLSTNQGIIRFHPDQKPYQFKQYTTRDGLSSNEFNPGAALMDSRGYIWFGSTKGVDVFHPDSIRDLGHAPQLAIVGLKIHDHEWHGDSSIEVIRRIELPHNQNTLRLELAAMEYLDPEHNKFKVLLQRAGEQSPWTDLGTQNFVTYANLKPGKYTFKFIACNAEGIWVEEKDARTLYFVIHPHWSDTWWFRTLLALLLLGFVATATAFYYRYHLRAQQLQNEKQQREAERQRMELETATIVAEGQRKEAEGLRKATESEMKLLRSQLNPHFLFNAMNSINRYILSNEKEKASEYLGQFAQLTRSILDNSRSLTIPLADELKMLHNYIALENLRFQQQIHWTFTVSPDLDEEDILVPSMFLQPFAENAILHGLAPKGGGHIAVEISQHEGSLQCVIRDDGAGRGVRTPVASDGKPRHASVGMRLISERLDAFASLEGQKAGFALHDLKDEAGQPAGTEVVIRLPLVWSV
jgi:ligand-binding sensor domain-containing protein